MARLLPLFVPNPVKLCYSFACVFYRNTYGVKNYEK